MFAQVHITIGDVDVWSTQQLASYVGQTVVFDDPLVVCSNASSTLTIAPKRMFVPENQGEAGSHAYQSAMHVNNSCAMSLSGVSGYHRCGEKIIGLTAKVNSTTSLTWQSGTWQGNDRAAMDTMHIRQLVNIPDDDSTSLLICSFNLENYFVEHLGKQYLGPNSYEDHQIQRAKISKALKKINADIFGLVELEQGDAAIGEIVSDLNKNLPCRNYQYFSGDASGTSQKSDYVYDANVVEPIGKPAEINTELQYRKKMICFREKATGEKFIFSINHFKAMNTGDEYRRVNEARAVVNFYNTYHMNNNIRDNDILVMGDLNSYGQTAPIFVFTDNGFLDLHIAFHADSSYSYMYGGKASYIDHALTNPTLRAQVTGMSAYHINSDEDDYYTYDKSGDKSMFRCSDHDPVLVGLKLDSTRTYDSSPTVNSMEILTGESATMTISNAHHSDQKSYYAIYSISGMPMIQGEILDPQEQVAISLPAGVYIVYIYANGEVYQRKIIVR